MTTLRKVMGGGLSLGVVGLSAFLWSRAQRQAVAAESPARDDDSEVRRELAGIREDLARLKSAGSPAAGGVLAPSAPPVVPAAVTSANLPIDVEEQDALLAETRRRVEASIERQLEREYRDPSWSAQAERGIEDAMSSLGKTLPGVRIESVDCATSLCRVVAAHDAPGTQKELAYKVTSFPPFDNEVFYKYDFDTAPPKTTMFVARSGYHLPRGSDGR